MPANQARQLLARFGETYAAYCRRVPRFNLLLGLWRCLRINP